MARAKNRRLKDAAFISRILDTSKPWPWKTTVSIWEIEKFYWARMKLKGEEDDYKVVRHYLDIIRKEVGGKSHDLPPGDEKDYKFHQNGPIC